MRSLGGYRSSENAVALSWMGGALTFLRSSPLTGASLPRRSCLQIQCPSYSRPKSCHSRTDRRQCDVPESADGRREDSWFGRCMRWLRSGVNIGFGGSAGTRSKEGEALQSALLQHHQFGILTPRDQGLTASCGDLEASHAMRRNNLSPMIPLRASVSASGDLTPLAYVAGAVTGSPDVYVQSATGIISAKQVLQGLNLPPAALGPKEGLGLMNGTSTSAAAASMVLYEAHHIIVLSQLLTTLTVEALLGTAASFASSFAEARPHRGQMESARNIRHFLPGTMPS